MNIPFIDLKAQLLSIRQEIDNAIEVVLDSTAFIRGKSVSEFEKSFASEIGVKHCIGVGNGTDALIIALKILEIGLGDEVIVPANSFIATAEAVTAAGAHVVFVDNNPKTYNIDVSKIELAITNKTKAIIAVHLYGQPAEMNSLLEIARKHNIFVIEDSAQSHLAEYYSKKDGWKKTGTFGDLACFSFYPGKNLGAYGDAGAIVTNNDELAKKSRMYSNHGRISKYNHEFEGVNSRMDEIQGAVLGVKLKYLRQWTELRRNAAKYYSKELNDVNQIIIPYVDYTRCNPVWHLYVIRTEQRDELQRFLNEKGISVGIHYPIALPNLQAYSYLGYKSKSFPIASTYQNQLLSLPIFPEISLKQQQYIINNIYQFFY